MILNISTYDKRPDKQGVFLFADVDTGFLCRVEAIGEKYISCNIDTFGEIVTVEFLTKEK